MIDLAITSEQFGIYASGTLAFLTALAVLLDGRSKTRRLDAIAVQVEQDKVDLADRAMAAADKLAAKAEVEAARLAAKFELEAKAAAIQLNEIHHATNGNLRIMQDKLDKALRTISSFEKLLNIPKGTEPIGISKVDPSKVDLPMSEPAIQPPSDELT